MGSIKSYEVEDFESHPTLFEQQIVSWQTPSLVLKESDFDAQHPATLWRHNDPNTSVTMADRLCTRGF